MEKKAERLQEQGETEDWSLTCGMLRCHNTLLLCGHTRENTSDKPSKTGVSLHSPYNIVKCWFSGARDKSVTKSPHLFPGSVIFPFYTKHCLGEQCHLTSGNEGFHHAK